MKPEIVPAAELEDVHLRNCRVLGSWRQLLERLPKNATVAEVGVDVGRSSEMILRATAPRTLHLIDVAIRPEVRRRFAAEIESGVVVVHESDSVAALRGFPDAHFDWIYVDGDHSEPGVRRDAEVAAAKVAPGGLLVFDDYIVFDHQAGEFYGVVQVVNDLCVHAGWEVAYLALQTEMFCKAALRRRGA